MLFMLLDWLFVPDKYDSRYTQHIFSIKGNPLGLFLQISAECAVVM